MDNKRKEASIEFILSQGLSTSKSMCALVLEMFQHLGFRFIFWDTAYSIVFAVLTIIPILIMLLLAPVHFQFATAVAVAPTLFLLILSLTETTERLGGLYELKQTCHYTVRQITALRIMCYSLVGMLYSVVVAILSTEIIAEFFSVFALCLCSLLICAIIALTAMCRVSMKWAVIVFSAMWGFCNLAMPFTFGSEWENFLKSIPIAATLSISTIALLFLIWKIRKMLMEVKPYVIA